MVSTILRNFIAIEIVRTNVLNIKIYRHDDSSFCHLHLCSNKSFSGRSTFWRITSLHSSVFQWIVKELFIYNLMSFFTTFKGINIVTCVIATIKHNLPTFWMQFLLNCNFFIWRAEKFIIIINLFTSLVSIWW